NRYQDGQCGYSSQPNFDASPQCQEGEVIDWCAKKECDPNIDNGRMVCFKEVKKADCSISLEVNNVTEEKCGAALTAQILLDSGGNDPVSYYGGAIPATVEPSEVAPEEAAPTPTPQPPIFNTWDPGYSTQWDPTPEPAPAPIPAIIITSPTAQERAMARYESRMEEMDQYQDEVFANIRTDQQGTGKVGNMVRNQVDRVEERINEIAESTIPMTREEVLQARRIKQKEEKLNKLTEQADKEYEQAEKQREEALQAAMNLRPEQRIAALNAAIGLPQDTLPDKTLMLFNNSAKALGVSVDVKEDGSYTVFLDQSTETGSLTYTPYVPGSSFAPAEISASQTIDPKPLCDHIKDATEKEKCQNEWQTLAVGGTVAMTAAGAAIVSAPVWLPALGTAATIVNTGTTAMYVYPTAAGTVLLSRSPAIVQQGLGVLAPAASVVIPLTVWGSCQTQADPVDCVSRDLGMADLPMVLTEGTKVTADPKAVSKVINKVKGGAEVAATKAVEMVSGEEVGSAVIRKARAGEAAVDDVLADGRSVWGVPREIEVECAGICSVINSAWDKAKGLVGLGETVRPLQVADTPKGSGFAAMSDWAKQNFRFLDSLEYQVILSNGERFTMADKAINNSGRVIVPLRDDQGKVSMTYLSTSEGDFKWFVGVAPDGWFIKAEGSKARADVAVDIDKGLKQALANKDIKVVSFKDDQTTRAALANFNMTYGSRSEGIQAMERRIDLLNGGSGAKEISFKSDYAADVDLRQPTDVVRDGSDKIDVYFGGSDCDCRVTFNLNPNTAPVVTFDRDKGSVAPQRIPIGFTFRPSRNPNDVYVKAPALSRTSTAADQARRSRISDSYAVEAQNGWMEYYQNIYPKLMQTPAGQEIARATDNFTKPLTPKEVDALVQRIQEQTPQDKSKVIQSLNPNGSWGPAAQIPAQPVSVVAPGVSVKPNINNAKNIDELFQAIDQKGGIKGSTRYYTSDQLKLAIQDVLSGKESINTITRSGKRSFLQNIWLSFTKFFGVREVLAAEDVTTSAVVSTESEGFDQMMTVEEFQLVATKTDVKNRLIENGKITSDEVKQLLTENSQIPAQGLRNGNRIVVTTGGDGQVEFEVDPGVYKIDSLPIEGVDLSLPATINVSSIDQTIGAGINKGSGQVKSSGQLTSNSQGQQVAKVKIVTFYDKNSNGIFDSEEKVIPWAGVVVSLTKAVQDKTISLQAGWNLVSLTALPGKTLTVTSLLKDIADQGGQATTVSTLIDGAWKSFVVRDGKEFSGDDFAIEVGKSYFVKTLKPSTFKYYGQNLVAPVKVKVQSGWNALSFPKTSKAYKASLLIDDVTKQASGSGTLAWWDFGLWDTFVQKETKQYGNDFDILPGFGYILKVEQEGEMTP
ncbi:hypothetical protein HYU93_01815, partial [Candidatus Daviesbacteria bacterium]|nr:hypothetical protein [Candidatus Daviesbacteria bacterium]